MWPGLLDLLFPPRCAGCGEYRDWFCVRCRGSVRTVPPPVCAACGDPMGGRSSPQAVAVGDAPGRCHTCRLVPPEFDLARSAAVYEDPLRAAIWALKFKGRRSLAAPLGRLLADLTPVEVTCGITAVVPVPLHRHRLSSRGFNQAELLARWMADRLGAPCIAGALRRVRQEVAQEALGVEARRSNVLGAFAPGRGALRGRILLVDDVFSTGATAAACSRVLRGMGAEAVLVYTLARALRRADIKGGPWIGRPTAGEETMQAPEEGRGHGASGGRAGGLASVRP